ncbi:MAG: methylated-DNA--[protein]-cysteine S-methyltransferase [Leptospiraceae bacterium]|nr:methylated-DNA--[protein]-cysteine S-methyltransferase [Leptospiraceae bacterium]
MKSILFQMLESPLGRLSAGVYADRLCWLEFHDSEDMATSHIRRLAGKLRAEIQTGSHPLFTKLQTQLGAYFSGERRSFDVPMLFLGTDFQQQSWQALCRIPYGTTWSYQRQATATGRPTAVRAVAGANAKNPIAILVPCHRVIAKSGGLSGYAGGVWRKQRLLALEAA